MDINYKGSSIKEFSEVHGVYVENIRGQTRLGYSISDNTDFYEISEIIKYGGFYKGSIIRFYDFETGKVYTPFEIERNVAHQSLLYSENCFYFLQGDFNKGVVSIYKYYPDLILEKIEEFKMEELDLYNLSLCGRELYLVSHNENFDIYYPYRKTVKLEGNETVLFIEAEKLYISAWIEEGWDDINDVASPDYEYYEKFIIKDLEGNTIHEQRGNLFQHIDGSWRIS